MEARERSVPIENGICKTMDAATSIPCCLAAEPAHVCNGSSYLTPVSQLTNKIESPHYDAILLEDEYCGEPTYDSPDPRAGHVHLPPPEPPAQSPPPLPPCATCPTCPAAKQAELFGEPTYDSPDPAASLPTSPMSPPSPLPPPLPPGLASVGSRLDMSLIKQAETQTDSELPRIKCRAWSWAVDWLSAHHTLLRRLVIAVAHALVIAYLAVSITHWANTERHRNALSFCDGLGLLLVVLGLVYAGLTYSYLIHPLCGPCVRKALRSTRPILKPIINRRLVRWAFAAVLVITCLALLIIDIGTDVLRLISLCGLLIFLGLGFVFSKHPRRVRWRPVLTGLTLQFAMGVFTIRFPQGRLALGCLADKVASMLRCANAGASFVFGEFLVIEKSVFAFQVLPVVFFFSSLIQVLYYLGAMQWLVARLGGVLQALMGTTVCESVNAAGSIFLGMTESPLLIRPFIEDLTRSELHAVMGTGFATASGSVLAAYISYGADPGHLLSASIMSATGALAYAKLLLPETEKSKTTAQQIGGRTKAKSDDSSIIDAAAKGASAAINIVLNIVANLVAFVSLLHLLNGVFGWLGTLVGAKDLSFESVLGKMFIPVAWLMGVEFKDCEDVAVLVGLKTVVNEFIAFQRMGDLKAAGRLSPRSLAITTLVLCGFANLSSLAILMSVLSAIAPGVRQVVTEVATRSLLCGVITCCITACIGGILMTEESFPSYVIGESTTTFPFNTTL